MQGFLSCFRLGSTLPPSKGGRQDLIVKARANGEQIFGQPDTGTYTPQPPATFFEDAKHIFLQAIY